MRKPGTWQIIPGLVLAAAPALAWAELAPDDYNAQLDAVQRQVTKERAHAPLTLAAALGYAPTAARMASLEQLPKLRSYKAGDAWDVAVFHERSGMNRLMGSSKASGRVFTYHYQVTDAAGPVIQISPSESYGRPSADARVKDVEIAVSGLTQARKSYSFKGRSARMAVSASDVRSQMSPIELAPIDFPNVGLAERVDEPPVAELPEALRDFLAQKGVKVDPSAGPWYETSDFFGRPVELLWRDGDPWPTVMKTTSGYAVLLRKEAA